MEEQDLVLHRDRWEALTMHVKLEKSKSDDSSSTDIRNCKYSPAYRTSVRLCVMFTMFIVILSLCAGTSAMPSTLLCEMRCLNGGKKHVPDGPFAYCMCKCPRGFVGLRCEFNRMFQPRRIRRINRLKRLVKIRHEVEGLLTDKKRRHRHFKR